VQTRDVLVRVASCLLCVALLLLFVVFRWRVQQLTTVIVMHDAGGHCDAWCGRARAQLRVVL